MGNVCCTDKNSAPDAHAPSTTTTKNKQPVSSQTATRSAYETSVIESQIQDNIIENSRQQSVEERASEVDHILSFKSYKGFKTVTNIKDFYKFGKELGAGSFGSVRLGKHIKSQVGVAIKVIKKSKVAQADVYGELMQQELEILEKTDHPHITRVFELLEDSKNFFVIMELVSGGNLLDRVIEAKKFSEADAAEIIHQLLLALNYMHKQGIAHRDLKPENLLCQSDKNLNVKLTDFGFAVFFTDKKMDLSLGSPLYMAPELAGEEKYDEKVDVWSTGVIVYILLSGQPPFFGSSKDEIYEDIQKKELNLTGSNWNGISQEAKDFITATLKKTSDERPSVQELFDHPWIVKNVKEGEVDRSVQLDISANLASFKKTSSFQSGVLSFMANLQTSAEELEDLKKMFIRLDSSKDGYLNADELRSGFSEIVGTFQAENLDFDTMIEAMDTDGDGRIDYTEFITAAFNRQKLLNKKNLDAAFKIFDSDGNGQITIDELKSVFGDRPGAGGDMWEKIMKEADKDNDNQISYEEFTQTMEAVLLERSTIMEKVKKEQQ